MTAPGAAVLLVAAFSVALVIAVLVIYPAWDRRAIPTPRPRRAAL
jgi:hypothetical protein